MSERSKLELILGPGGITSVYQPVVRALDGTAEVIGFECLSRGPRGTNFESANILFDYVRLKREESLVDRACVAAALSKAAPLRGFLSVNVHASTLGRDPGFVDFLPSTAEQHGIALSRLVIEIVEHAPSWDGLSFLAALDRLRSRGARIALDDIGLGQSNFKMLLDVGSDYLKIDRYFVEGCATDPRRRAVLASLAQLAAQFGAELIAEGVANEADRDALRAMGVTLMQGFLFAAPMGIEEASRFRGAAA